MPLSGRSYFYGEHDVTYVVLYSYVSLDNYKWVPITFRFSFFASTCH